MVQRFLIYEKFDVLVTYIQAYQNDLLVPDNYFQNYPERVQGTTYNLHSKNSSKCCELAIFNGEELLMFWIRMQNRIEL